MRPAEVREAHATRAPARRRPCASRTSRRRGLARHPPRRRHQFTLRSRSTSRMRATTDRVDGLHVQPVVGLRARLAGLRALLRRHARDPVRPRRSSWGAGHGFRFFGDKHWAEPLKWARAAGEARRRRASSARRWPTCSRSARARRAPRAALRPDRGDARARLAAPHEAPEFARDWLFALLRRAALYDVAARTCGWACRSRTPATRGAPTSSARSRPPSGSSAPSRCSAASYPEATRRRAPCDDAGAQRRRARARKPLDLTGIDWVIIGGESGPKARPFHLEHAREIIDSCSLRCDCGTTSILISGCRCERPAVFVKQLGARSTVFVDLRDRKGGVSAEVARRPPAT
jgi:hypothetical protein